MVFTSLLDTHTILATLTTYGFLIFKEGLQGTVGHSIFAFFVIIFSVSDWLEQGSNRNKKGYNRIPWSFLFPRTPLPSFWLVWNRFWLVWKHGVLGLLLLIPLVDVHVYLVFALSLAELPHIVSPLEFCAHKAVQILYANGVARTGDRHTSYCLFMSVISLDFSSET